MNNGRTTMTLALLKGGVLSEEEMAEREEKAIAEKAAEYEKKHQEFLESERKYQEQRERIKKKIIPLTEAEKSRKFLIHLCIAFIAKPFEFQQKTSKKKQNCCVCNTRVVPASFFCNNKKGMELSEFNEKILDEAYLDNLEVLFKELRLAVTSESSTAVLCRHCLTDLRFWAEGAMVYDPLIKKIMEGRWK